MTVFEEALLLSNMRWVDTLPDDLEVPALSKKRQKEINKLFDKMRGDKYHRFTRRATAALIAAILFVTMTVTAFAIPATREFIIKDFFGYSTYSVANPEENEVTDLTIGYIPEGFEKVDEYMDIKSYSYEYYSPHNKQWFNITKEANNRNVSFNTDDSKYSVIEYNKIRYIYYTNSLESDLSYGFIWNKGNYVYTFNTNLPKDISFLIIESIE